MWRFLSRVQTEQPLLLFLVFGLALFGADAALRRGDPAGMRADARTIVVGGEHARRLLERYPSAGRRTLSPAELREALGAWIEDEVLIREAQAIGLDAGDVIVRRRLAQKMMSILEQLHPVPEPSEGELRVLLEADPERYGHRATVSFEQVFLSRARHGAGLGAAAAEMLERLSEDGGAFRQLGEAPPTGQVASAATADELRRRYGGAFAAALDGLPVGGWQGPIASSLGLHLVRVTARTPSTPAALDEVREDLRRDYRAEQRKALDRAAIDELLARFAIAVRPPEDGE